jgi:lipoprotein-anchoring transpeptidase ErfK/SrfK
MRISLAAVSAAIAVLCTGVAAAAAQTATYRIEATDAPTLKKRYSAAQLGVLEKLNRRDLEHLVRLDEMIVPVEWRDDELAYAPLPLEWAWAADKPKTLIVDQPSQLFGAYEHGQLVRWGPISSGRKETPTPAGAYALTWRSRKRVSTDNDQWVLEWYFNFINARGISFHQFDLPGLPASHACVRLLQRDAMWLYEWGQQWVLTKDRLKVETPGTPVIVQSVFDFDKPAPWLSLDWWRAPIVLPLIPTSFAPGAPR